VIVTNRSFDRAVDLARTFGGTPVPFDRFLQYLHLADVVLGSVAAPGYMIGPPQLNEVMRARRRRPMFLHRPRSAAQLRSRDQRPRERLPLQHRRSSRTSPTTTASSASAKRCERSRSSDEESSGSGRGSRVKT
jgi:hypothetical protein